MGKKGLRQGKKEEGRLLRKRKDDRERERKK